MSIIKVTTNILEDYQVTTTVKTPFNPFIVARFPSGPIGKWVKLSSIRELQNIFGKVTSSLPVAYGIKQYLSEYRDIYVYRVAGANAVEGSALLTFEANDETIPLVELKTLYKTEQLNSSKIRLLKETSVDSLYLEITTPYRTYRTSSVEFDVSTGTADQLAIVMETLVNAMNALQTEFVLTNKFLPSVKTADDPVPSDYTILVKEVEGGNSGNLTTIDKKAVIDSLQYLQDYDIIIDAILAPEFDDNREVVEALSVKADQGDFIHLVSPSIGDVANKTPLVVATSFLSITNQLPACKSRIILYPSVFINDYDDDGVIQGQVEVPLSVVALKTYALTDDIGKWYAPEGISDANRRGLLTNVTSMKIAVPAEAAELLYNAKNPVNYLQYISGIGVILFGDKTNLASSKVFSKIHVVRLSKYLHRVYQNIGLTHIGEPIDDFTYEDISAKLRKELDSIVAARGIESYTVKCDNENNTEEMRQDGIIYTLSRIKFFNIAEVIENDLVFTNYIVETNDNGEGDRLI